MEILFPSSSLKLVACLKDIISKCQTRCHINFSGANTNNTINKQIIVAIGYNIYFIFLPP